MSFSRQVEAAIDELPAALQAASEGIVRHIKGRTLTGRDITGARFASYAPSTVAQSKGSAQPVQLRGRGQMMNDLAVRGSGMRREVFLTTARSNQIGIWHMQGTRTRSGGTKLPRRLWFGITERYSRILFVEIADRLQRKSAGKQTETVRVTI